MTAAALGTHLDIPTLESDLKDRDAKGDESDHDQYRDTVGIDIVPGTQSGDVVTVRGQGVSRLRGPGRGDLVVQVMVETPDQLDDDQRDLLQQLAVLRAEERPEARLGASHKSVFGRIKDAFR
jgi:molecular chaperone DnaJ